MVQMTFWKWFAVIVVFALILVSNCLAQDLEEVKPHPNSPSVHVKLYDDQNNMTRWVLPVPHKTADKAFWITTAVSAVVTVGDLENTQVVLNHGGRELNPLYGPHPNRLRQYSIGGAIFALSTYMSYRAKRIQDAEKAFGVRPEHPKWILGEVTNIGSHVFGIVFTLGATGK